MFKLDWFREKYVVGFISVYLYSFMDKFNFFFVFLKYVNEN